jgi:hypothetical protein
MQSDLQVCASPGPFSRLRRDLQRDPGPPSCRFGSARGTEFRHDAMHQITSGARASLYAQKDSAASHPAQDVPTFAARLAGPQVAAVRDAKLGAQSQSCGAGKLSFFYSSRRQ